MPWLRLAQKVSEYEAAECICRATQAECRREKEWRLGTWCDVESLFVNFLPEFALNAVRKAGVMRAGRHYREVVK